MVQSAEETPSPFECATSGEDDTQAASALANKGCNKPSLRYDMVDANLESLRKLCGSRWIETCNVKYGKNSKVGEGAFATVNRGSLVLTGRDASSFLELQRKASSSLSVTTSKGSGAGALDVGGGASGTNTRVLVEVAVKQLKPDRMEELDKKDFILEAAVLSKLRHPCIVKMYGVGAQPDGKEFILVSEFMNGGTIKDLIWKQMESPYKRLYTDADAARWCLQVARGLAYLHASQPVVIHRDLKPENILLKGPSVHKMDAKLADFGLHVLVSKPKEDKAKTAYEQLATMRSTEKLIKTAEGAVAEDAAAKEEAFSRQASRSNSRGKEEALSREASRSNYLGSRETSRSNFSASGSHCRIERTGSSIPMRSLTLAKMSAAHVVRQSSMVSGTYQLTGCTGSFLYMAPEVFQQQAYNEKVDVYSFGMIMFELFAREITFYGMQCRDQVSDVMAYVESIALDDYRPEIPSKMPPEIASIVRRCWDSDSFKRPDMRTVVDELRAFMQANKMMEVSLEADSSSYKVAKDGAKDAGCSCAVM